LQPRASPWTDRFTRLNGVSLLTILLFFDLTFILVHIWLWSRGLLTAQLSVEADGSLPEWFNYAKWAAGAVACGYCFSRRREPLYLAWSILFAYFLLDDANQIHELVGRRFVIAFDLGPALALRAQDFGELAVSIGAAIVLLGSMVVAYRAADASSNESKDFTRRQLPWLGALIFCGVVVDMVHIQIMALASPHLTLFAGVLEDGGEMIAASFLTAISIRQAALIIWESLRS